VALLSVYPDEPVASHRWQKIADALGNRTARQVASHAQKYFIRLAREGQPVPASVHFKVCFCGFDFLVSFVPRRVFRGWCDGMSAVSFTVSLPLRLVCFRFVVVRGVMSCRLRGAAPLILFCVALGSRGTKASTLSQTKGAAALERRYACILLYCFFSLSVTGGVC
jgi:hypothetical protein